MTNKEKCTKLLDNFTEEQLEHIMTMLKATVTYASFEVADTREGYTKKLEDLFPLFNTSELAAAHAILSSYDELVDAAFCEELARKAKDGPDYGVGDDINTVAKRLGVDL